jgi:hypothetical protein
MFELLTTSDRLVRAIKQCVEEGGYQLDHSRHRLPRGTVTVRTKEGEYLCQTQVYSTPQRDRFANTTEARTTSMYFVYVPTLELWFNEGKLCSVLVDGKEVFDSTEVLICV